MSFRKSLYYILRYIVFILHNHTDNLYETLRTKYINFIIYVDSDTFNIYKSNIDIINNIINTNPIKKVDDEIIKYWEKKNFAAILHSINEQDFKNCLHEIFFLKNIIDNINIYFLESSNYLMKGIGGKRAVMNYVNYLIADKNCKLYNDKKNYKSMYLDDNISMIIHLSDTDNKSKLCQNNKREHKDDNTEDVENQNKDNIQSIGNRKIIIRKKPLSKLVEYKLDLPPNIQQMDVQSMDIDLHTEDREGTDETHQHKRIKEPDNMDGGYCSKRSVAQNIVKIYRAIY